MWQTLEIGNHWSKNLTHDLVGHGAGEHNEKYDCLDSGKKFRFAGHTGTRHLFFSEIFIYLVSPALLLNCGGYL
jgi:hypothetical protein